MKVTSSMFNTSEPVVKQIRKLEHEKYKKRKKLKQTREERMEDRFIEQLEKSE